MKIEVKRFGEYSLWSMGKSEKIWWITHWTISKKGKEIYRLNDQSTLPTSVLRMWAKVTGLIPLNKFNGKHGSYVYSFNGVEYITGKMDGITTTFEPLST